MKNRWIAVAAFFSALSLSTPLVTAASDWTVVLGDVQVRQVLADGAGGVAVSYESAAAPGLHVSWFDALGRVMVNKTLSGTNGGITDVSNRAIVLTEPEPFGEFAIFVLDRQGRETAYANTFANPAFIDRNTDVNGFFALRFDSTDNVWLLLRFSY